MRQADFERQHQLQWLRLERWIGQYGLRRAARRTLDAKAGPASPPLPDADMPAAYRQACAHLALARERRYAPALVDRLHRIVLEGHHVLYAAGSGQRFALLEFVRRDFPALVRREWRPVWLASLLFFGPLLAMLALVQLQPEASAVVLSPQQLGEIEAMYDASNERLGRRGAEDDSLMFGFYIWNNVRIGFQTFAGGILAGLGSLFFLLYNGLVIGTLIGHLTQVGLGPQIWSFVAGHSALELVAIAISGAAGLKLGGALLMPGRRSRRLALIEEGRIALRLAGGAALMFVAAAAVEAFWSPRVLPDPLPKYVVGVLGWVLVLAYLALAGRPRAA